MSGRGTIRKAERDALRLCIAKLHAQVDGLLADGRYSDDPKGGFLWEDFQLPQGRTLSVSLRVELREPAAPTDPPAKAKAGRLAAPSPLLMIEGPRR
ncbi:hypothetical protein [Falsiroseomonas sp.]|uniref:hypothetical protein n=1 Tax=Falsiroseomonas sp. TaxID=2870721 RepID=UPI003F70633F